ncbi:MAG TPA: hypothetical protein VHP83_13575 [Aggregatilineaceae bacterium]|nr:hypothetical protein [Aggregatilineaceae bacterium]
MSEKESRYLIVGPGRTGSSLLSAILVNIGASFDLPVLENWESRAGAYEHPLIHSARRWQLRMLKIDDSLIPNGIGESLCAKRMQHDLREVLERACYVKSSDLVWLVHPIYKLGYWPRIIVSYRDFMGYARSRYLKYGFAMHQLVQMYVEVYSTALLELHTFGGCVIDYADMLTERETGWANALSQISGISMQSILDERGKIVDHEPRPALPLYDFLACQDDLTRIQDSFEALKGVVVEPK